MQLLKRLAVMTTEYTNTLAGRLGIKRCSRQLGDTLSNVSSEDVDLSTLWFPVSCDGVYARGSDTVVRAFALVVNETDKLTIFLPKIVEYNIVFNGCAFKRTYLGRLLQIRSNM